MSLDSQAYPHGKQGGTVTVAYGFAGMIVLAVIVLFALRHIFGSIHIEAGVR